MEVTIRVREDNAVVLYGQRPSNPAAKELLHMVEELAVVLEPLHPGSNDPHLIPYFRINVPDRAAAERIISRLQRCRAVEAAYVKPPDELP